MDFDPGRAERVAESPGADRIARDAQWKVERGAAGAARRLRHRRKSQRDREESCAFHAT